MSTSIEMTAPCSAAADDFNYIQLSPTDSRNLTPVLNDESRYASRPREFRSCWQLLDNQHGIFGSAEESRFVDALEFALKKVSHSYSTLCNALDDQNVQAHEVSEVWRFSRRARADLLELILAHDRRTPSRVATSYDAIRLNSFQFFTSAGVSDVLLTLSDRFRNRESSVKRDCDQFVRTNYKFLVRTEDVVDVMCSIMPHLPLYVFKKNGEVFSPIHSIYLDSEDLDLYHAKVSKVEGARLLRLRWYDSDDEKLFVETKVSKNRIAQTPGYKTRAALDRSLLNDLLHGRPGVTPDVFDKAQPKERELLTRFREEVQALKAQPVLRTTCRRVCFQLPNDASLRVTIDLDVEALLEGGAAGNNGNGHDSWQWNAKVPPFLQSPGEALHFPMAIVEVKLESDDLFAQMPTWLDQIVRQQYEMREVDVSKYTLATATLLQDRIRMLPEWFQDLPELNQDNASSISQAPTASEAEKEKLIPKSTKIPRRTDPKLVMKAEQLFINWLAVAGVPLASITFGGYRSRHPLVHFVFLGMTIAAVVYAARRYWERIELLTTGQAIQPDKSGVVFAAMLVVAYGIIATVSLLFED